MVKAQLFSSKGESKGTVALTKDFEGEINLPLLAQAVHVFRDRSHIGLAKTKTRAEVDRTKKKVYRQKGTGGARHGSRSAPIYVGGGVAHGPKATKRELKLSDKMRILAKKAALAILAKGGKILAIDGIADIKKTKDAEKLLVKIGAKNALVVLSQENANASRPFANIENLRIKFFKDINAYDLYLSKSLVVDAKLLEGTPKKVVAKKIKKEIGKK